MTEYYKKLSDATANSIIVKGRETVIIQYVECNKSKYYKPGSFYKEGNIKGYVEYRPRMFKKRMNDLDDYFVIGDDMPIITGFNKGFWGSEVNELWVKTEKGFTKKAFKTTIKVTMEEII